MSTFNIPSKVFTVNKRKKEVNLAERHYKDMLPTDLDMDTVERVHEFDDLYIGTAITKGAKIASRLKGDTHRINIHMPNRDMYVDLRKGKDPIAVLNVDFDEESKVAQALKMLKDVGDQ